MTVKLKNKIPLYYQTKYDTKNLTLYENKTYIVLSISDSFYRIIDEDGEPILFSCLLFDIVDNNINDNWVINNYADFNMEHSVPLRSGIFLTPKEFERYFYTKFFDKEKNSIITFLKYITKYNIPLVVNLNRCPDFHKKYYEKLLNQIKD